MEVFNINKNTLKMYVESMNPMNGERNLSQQALLVSDKSLETSGNFPVRGVVGKEGPAMGVKIDEHNFILPFITRRVLL